MKRALIFTVAILNFHLADLLSQTNSYKNIIDDSPDGRSAIFEVWAAYRPGRRPYDPENRKKPGKWYRDFTFSQETNFIKDGKVDRTEIWHEASSSPGKLLIKFNSKGSKNGVLFCGNKAHIFKEGVEPVVKDMIHELTLTAFDIYFVDPYLTMKKLDSLKYDLNKRREDVFEGRKSLVIGADKGDSLSRQIWYDKERHYLQKVIYKKGESVQEAIFTDYKKIEKNWVATKVIFKQDGKKVMEEKYFDIKFPKDLDPAIFDPKKFNETSLK